MQTTTLTAKERIEKALSFLDAHPECIPTLAEISDIAHCSPYHFHRLFKAYTGSTVQSFIAAQRLHRAAFQLAFRPQLSVLDIALSNGYQSPEGFSRAFRKRYQVSAKAYRSDRIKIRQLLNHPPKTQERAMTSNFASVECVYFSSLKIYEWRHRGLPTHISDSVLAFIAWRKTQGLSPSRSRTFNIFYGDPNIVDNNTYSLGLAVERIRSVSTPPEVKQTEIPGQYCARLRYIGPDSGLDAQIRHLYQDWLPTSQKKTGTFPLFIERVAFYPEVSKNQMITDIYLPLSSE
jgi:AraC family transcriptional regulator